MRRNQQGMTAISFIILAAIVALIGFAGLKLTPIYLENMKIQKTLADVKAEFDGTNPSIRYIRSAIGKRLVIEMIDTLKPQDFTIKKSERGYSVRAQYERRASFIGNLYLLGVFNNSVEILR